jgi:hypothetical protein
MRRRAIAELYEDDRPAPSRRSRTRAAPSTLRAAAVTDGRRPYTRFLRPLAPLAGARPHSTVNDDLNVFLNGFMVVRYHSPFSSSMAASSDAARQQRLPPEPASDVARQLRERRR